MSTSPQVIQSGLSPFAAAAQLVLQLREQYGPLLFHQSGGCCDGSSPMCYPQAAEMAKHGG